MDRHWKIAAMGCLVGAVTGSGFVPTRLNAADEKASKGAPTKAAPKEETEFKIKLDPYAPPAGTETKALKLFVTRLTNLKCASETKEGFLAHLEKIDKALVDVLSRKVEQEIQLQASELRFEVLSKLSEEEVESANTRRETLLNSLIDDKRPEVSACGKRMYIFERLQTFDELKPNDIKELTDDIAAFLKDAKEINRDHLMAAQDLAIQLEGKLDFEKAIAAYAAYGKIVATKTGPGAEAASDVFKAGMLRCGLLGKKISLKGTTIEGDAFDIAKWKGKVVLIDFWATWCPPCLGEVPNFKKQYELYHSKGFEVVGISLDEKTEDVKELLQKDKLPWATLIEPDEANRQWNTPACKQFGVRAIPACFLVAQDGTVVSITAKGEELNKQLAKLLGPASGSKAPLREASGGAGTKR